MSKQLLAKGTACKEMRKKITRQDDLQTGVLAAVDLSGMTSLQWSDSINPAGGRGVPEEQSFRRANAEVEPSMEIARGWLACQPRERFDRSLSVTDVIADPVDLGPDLVVLIRERTPLHFDKEFPSQLLAYGSGPPKRLKCKTAFYTG